MKPFLAHIGLDCHLSVFFKPIDSYFFVYPWSQGYSFERDFDRGIFKRSAIAEPEGKTKGSHQVKIYLLLSYECYVLVTDSVTLGVGEIFATDCIDQDFMKLNTFKGFLFSYVTINNFQNC